MNVYSNPTVQTHNEVKPNSGRTLSPAILAKQIQANR
jgi:hypothetical protein